MKRCNDGYRTTRPTPKLRRGWQLGMAIALGVSRAISLLGCLAIAFTGSRALAQITPDDTLGSESSIVTPNVDVQGLPADLIEGGATRGANLFHSFSDFNVEEGLRVYFANPAGIENILSRVTGSNISNILGTLGVDGGANLFLLNPNGMIFGENATLDISGSFVASTADSVVFGNGLKFSANNPEAPPLLAINVPIGLQYGANPSGAVENAGNLAVGGDLILSGATVTSIGRLSALNGQVGVAGVAGDVQIQDVTAKTATLFASENLVLEESQLRTTGDLNLLAEDTVWMRDSITNPLAAHAGGNLYIQGNQGIDILALNHPETPFQSSGNLTLVSDGDISGDSHFSSAGNYSILNLAGEPGTFFSYYDPIIRSDGNVIFGDYTGVALKVEAAGSITAGNIKITGPDQTGAIPGTDPDYEHLTTSSALILRAGVSVHTTTDVNVSQGPPEKTVNDGGTVFTSGSVSYSTTTADASPTDDFDFNFTDISLTGTLLPLRDDEVSSPINLGFTFNYFGANYDNIYVSSNGFISPEPPLGSGCCTGSSLPSSFYPNATIAGWWEDLNPSAGGNIYYQRIGVETDTDQSFIVQFTDVEHYPNGNPVTFQIELFKTSNNIEVRYPSALTDGGIHSAGLENQSGTIGLQFFNGTTAIGKNTAVRYTPITATNTVDNSITVLSINTSSDSGNGGPVILNAVGDITVKGNINSSSSNGNGGSIDIVTTTGDIYFENSRVRSITEKQGGRDAGDISIEANNGAVSLINSSLDAGALANGSGGNVSVIANSVTLDGSSIFSDTSSDNTDDSGGQITVTAGAVSLINQSLLDASTNGRGNGGSISVNTNGGSVAIDNSSIKSTVGAGAGGIGGDIEINTGSLSMTNGGVLEARTLGNRTIGTDIPIEDNARAGNITVNVIDSDSSSPAFNLSGYNSDGISSGLFTSSEEVNSGRGSNIIVNVPNGTLSVSNGAVLSARTQGNSPGGSIKIDVNTLEVTNGGQLIATSSSNGAAGSININAINNVTISGFDSQFSSRGGVTRPPDGSGLVDENEGSSNDNIGDSIKTAQPIILSDFNLVPSDVSLRDSDEVEAFNNVESATLLPYLSIRGTGDGTFDYYSFYIPTANSVGIFDIDKGYSVGSIDTQLFLFSVDSGGNPLRELASNDDFRTSAGAGGSTNTYSSTSYDSFLRYTFREVGTYVIGVGRYPSSASDSGIIEDSSTPPQEGSSYTLQVSIGSAAALSVGLNPNLGPNSGLYTQTNSTGEGGNITIKAGAFLLNNSAELNASTLGPKKGGDITIESSSVSLTNAAQINARTFADGYGGNVSVLAQGGSVSLTDISKISTAVADEATGKGGNIYIDTGSVSLTGGARLEALTLSSGDAGNINIFASDSVEISGSGRFGIASGLLTSSERENSGLGGTIRINDANNIDATLRVSDGAFLSARTRSASEGGDIELYVDSLEVTSGGQLITSSSSSGRAGDISIYATDSVTISGSNPTFDDSSGNTNDDGSNGSGLLSEMESNNSIAEAQNIEPLLLSLEPNFDIESSTTIPYLSIQGSGDGTFDYYSFNIQTANSRAIFDIDYGTTDGLGSIDTQLFLFNKDTGELLASNDDFSTSSGAGGSQSRFDSYINYIFNAPGNYVLGVGQFYSQAAQGGIIEIGSTPPSGGTSYTLQVSINDPNLNLSRNTNPNAIANSGLFTQADGTGDAGKLTINTGQLSVQDRAVISASTVSGNSDGITLQGLNDQPAMQLLQVNNSQISASTQSGTAGNLDIRANTISLDANASLTATNTSSSIGGNITLRDLDTLQVLDNSQISASTQTGQAGSLRVNVDENAAQLVQVSGQGSRLSAEATREGGDAQSVTINTQQLRLTDGAQISASNISKLSGDITLQGVNTLEVNDSLISASTKTGEAGNLIVNAAESVQLSGLFNGNSGGLSVQATDGGKAGFMSITTGELTVTDGASATVSSTRTGIAGSLDVRARSIALNNNASLSATNESSQVGGNITLQGIDNQQPLETVEVNNSLISASTQSGTAGNLSVNASESILLNGTLTDGTAGGLAVSATNGGNAGSLSMTTGNLTVQNGSQATVSSTGTGIAGNLDVNAQTVTLNNQARLSAETAGGSGGNIELEGLNTLEVNNSLISASTQSGTAGNLSVNASESVLLNGTLADGTAGGLAVSATDGGNAGSLSVTTGNLTVQNGAQATVSSTGTGTAGSLTVNAQTVALNNQARLSAETAGGSGGNIELEGLNTLEVNNSLISASTQSGTAGNLSVNATESVLLNGTLADGTAAGLAVSATNGGSAGSLSITTSDLNVENGASATVSSTGTGTAGSLNVNAQTVALNNQARLSAETAGGSGGNISLQGLNTLNVNNSRISASTQNGIAGDVTINASDAVYLRGDGGLYVEATDGGIAGNLRIATGDFIVSNGAQATVSSPEGQAGNLTVTANSMRLNRGKLTAETGGGAGGANILLNISDILWMENESLISANASGAANGGNITINTTFIIALPPEGPEGSDIVANAFQGNGGKVNITAQGILNIQFRPTRTPLNDITASSQFGAAGVVAINTPNVDPSRGLTSLPTDLVDPTGLIDRSCQAGGGEETGQFTVTGRGGLPPNPNEPLGEEGLLDDLGVPVSNSNGQQSGVSTDWLISNSSTPAQIIEAQGWVKQPDGSVILVAQTASATPQSPRTNPASCQVTSHSATTLTASPR